VPRVRNARGAIRQLRHWRENLTAENP
jgi:hypothetical protein